MLTRISALLTISALAGLVACGDDGTQTGQDATVMDAQRRMCPERAPWLTAAGQVNGASTSSVSGRIMRPFTFDADLTADPEDVLFHPPTNEGFIKAESVDGNVELTIDIAQEPLEGEYKDDPTVVKVSVVDKDTKLSMLGAAPNVASHIVTITCWDPEGARLDGTFSASWVEDNSGGFIQLGYGDITGEFSVALTKR